MLKTVAKRGRGRPSKAATKTVKKVGKRSGRGRPAGSKNKIRANEVGPRIERLESVVALLAEILGGIMGKMAPKKGK